jgi:hypothetical protein
MAFIVHGILLDSTWLVPLEAGWDAGTTTLCTMDPCIPVDSTGPLVTVSVSMIVIVTCSPVDFHIPGGNNS